MTTETSTSTLPTSDIHHTWVRRPKGQWRRIYSGSPTECEAAISEFRNKNPAFTDGYIGRSDPTASRHWKARHQ